MEGKGGGHKKELNASSATTVAQTLIERRLGPPLRQGYILMVKILN